MSKSQSTSVLVLAMGPVRVTLVTLGDRLREGRGLNEHTSFERHVKDQFDSHLYSQSRSLFVYSAGGFGGRVRIRCTVGGWSGSSWKTEKGW